MENMEEVDGHPEQFVSGTTDLLQEVQVPEDNCVPGESFRDEITPPDLSLGFLPIRARISEDAHDENEVAEDEYESEEGTEGSYSSSENSDSAIERMSVTSTGETASSVGFYAEAMPFSAESIHAQRTALLQLNELNCGVASLDTSIMQDTSEEQFRHRIMDIAVAKDLPLDDEIIHSILSALVPVVREAGLKGSAYGRYFLQVFGDNGKSMPVAKPTVEDEDDVDARDAGEPNENQSEASGQTSTRNHVEDEGSLPDSAFGLPVRGADYESEEQDDITLTPSESEGVYQIPNQVCSTEQHDDTLEVISDHVSKEMGSNGGQESSTLSRSFSEDEIQLEKTVGSCSHHQSHDATQSPDESTGCSTSNAFQVIDDHLARDNTDLPLIDDHLAKDNTDLPLIDDHLAKDNTDLPLIDDHLAKYSTDLTLIDHHLAKDNTDLTLTVDPQESPFEVTDTQVAQPIQSDISESNANLSIYPVKEDNDHPKTSDIIDEYRRHEVQSLDENTVEANPNISEIVIENVESDQVLGVDTDEDTEEEEGIDDDSGGGGGGDDDEDERSTSEKSSLLDAFIKFYSSQVEVIDIPSLGGAGPSPPVPPAGLGSPMPFLEHLSRSVQHSTVSSATSVPSTSDESGHSNTDLSEELAEAEKQLQMLRVKFLRLAQRLGQSANNGVVAQVLYRLGLAEQLGRGEASGRTRAINSERAAKLAEEQEAGGIDDLDFGCTIMVLGKTGVGKSATINSLFGGSMSVTDAYNPATRKAQALKGEVHGIKLTVIDTPGLCTSFAEQGHNKKIMASVKRFIRKSPPDIVLYIDRLDMPCRNSGDLALLRTITNAFGAAIWFNAIVVLTHASSDPPDGANGMPVSYEMLVAQRSHMVQQVIRQAAGDIRLMNPMSLVENHPASTMTNREGQYVLPDGQIWKSQLLFLCSASKILAEANALFKLQDTSPIQPFVVRPRMPPLPFLLSSLLQSHAHMKHLDEVDDDAAMLSDSDDEAASDDEEEFDDLPPFRHLTRAELGLLDTEQRRIYHEEIDYREKLFMEKQLKEERARRRRNASLASQDVAEDHMDGQFEEERAASGEVPVPMPDMALPLSFDSDNPTYRYRSLETTTSQWLVRPVLETHGWDHDSGYDGLNVEKAFVAFKRIPASVSGQIMKDKKESSVQMECSGTLEKGDGRVTLAGLEIQTIGKDLIYTVRGETRFHNLKHNRTSCGLSLSTLGDTVSAGMKIEDELLLGKQCKLLVNGGALTGRGDVAYGGSLEATFKGKDYPIVQEFLTLGLSVMNWHGDVAVGGNLQIQCKVGKAMVGARANLNNRGSGQITIRANSCEQTMFMAVVGLIPLLSTCFQRFFLHSGHK